MKLPHRAQRVLFLMASVLLLAEIGARITIDHILHRSPQFRLDRKLGWVRRVDGDKAVELKHDAAKMTVILGDSFVYGHGVTPNERFDRYMRDMGYEGVIVNRGVSGYSTDQEFLADAPLLASLKKGDTVVLVTFGDDLRGLLSGYFAGRPKPRYQILNGQMSLVEASIPWWEVLTEGSYLARIGKEWALGRQAVPPKMNFKDLDLAQSIYDQLVMKHLISMTEKGVKVVLVYHGHKIVDDDFGDHAGLQIEYNIRRLSEQYGFTYLYLDPEMDRAEFRPPADIHWNVNGHQKFAELLFRACDSTRYQIHLNQKETR